MEVDDKVVGFVSCGKASDTNFNGYGELFALYIVEEYKKKGYGKKMYEKAVNQLKLIGFDKMIVGCLKGNPANGFYEYMGASKIGERIIFRNNQKLIENIYVYKFNFE